MSHGKYLVNNYRPVQMTDNRDVTSSFDMENAGSSIKASWFAVSLITFFILAFVWAGSDLVLVLILGYRLINDCYLRLLL